VAELFASLQAALADRYTIEREVGHGGMATVYLAQDRKHHRRVAIKVLRPELAAALGPERFLREIEIAAKLAHPNILMLIDSGEAAGLLYFVMPYVEGDSLRERLNREKQLALDDALQITREVADALGHAHSLGIVHRDIKPENILFEAGQAVVSDFGIARAITVAGGGRLTETGVAVGTPAYMSPEQAAGERQLDGRSDLYSLGCVLYEMLAGEPPFTGPSAQAVLARHTLDPVPPLRTVRKAVPEHVERAALKALEKVAADRFATARQFVDALDVTPAVPLPTWRRILGRRSVRVGLGVTIVVAAAGLGLRLRSSRGPKTSDPPHPKIVVLPFQNLGAPEDRWFADGITEEITSRLGQISGLGVISRTSAMQSAGKPLHEIATELGVQYVLEGTIRSDQLPDGVRQVRVTPQLIRVSDDTHLWAERYTASLARGEIFDAQANIAEHVAQALDVTLREGERQALRTKPTANPEAYDAYLRGNQYAHGGYLKTDSRAAMAVYRRAVELDPQFSEAHARLSDQYSLGCLDSTLALALRHAEHALALNPDLAWGHLALADYYLCKGDWEHHRSEVALAEKFGANSGEILQLTSWLHYGLGEYDGFVRNSERAFELDPLSADNALTLGVAYFTLRRHAEAERYIDRAIALDPGKPESYMYKTWLYLSWHGSVDEARSVLQTAVEKLGPERAFAGGFLQSYWWVSRILAKDPWYRSMLGQVSLGAPDLDSTNYYMHKAALFEGLHEGRKARAYWDSVVTVVGGRLRRPLAGALWDHHSQLALGNAGLGNKEEAIREARRVAELAPRGVVLVPLVMALTYAEVGERDAAVEQFERLASFPGNWVTPKFLALDPTLEPLRQVPRFRRLLGGH
jgi:serine/threonine protein kinase/tetratricopeptide (TPR) repeat protein